LALARQDQKKTCKRSKNAIPDLARSLAKLNVRPVGNGHRECGLTASGDHPRWPKSTVQRGNEREAAGLYRRAALALLDAR
jgi:hypothetical protein